jgi:hypothetical protein
LDSILHQLNKYPAKVQASLSAADHFQHPIVSKLVSSSHKEEDSIISPIDKPILVLTASLQSDAKNAEGRRALNLELTL